MTSLILPALRRSTPGHPNALRKKGFIPCILYGFDVKNTPVQCEERLLQRTFRQAGGSTLINLELEQKTIPVLLNAVARDPVKDTIIHVDFLAVNLREEIEADVPIRFEGQAPAAKNMIGILLTPADHVRVRCLPTNLPHELPVSVETLTGIGLTLTIRDIPPPKGVTILGAAETVIAIIQEPRKETEEIAPPKEAATGEAEEKKEKEAEKKTESKNSDT